MGYGKGNEARKNSKQDFSLAVTKPVSSNGLWISCQTKDGTTKWVVSTEPKHVTFLSETGIVTVTITRNL